MADVTITPASVSLRASPSGSVVQVGEAVAAGQALYLKAADSKYWLADGNVGVAEAAVIGIAMVPAAADEYTYMVTAGTIDIGGTTAVGVTYILSATPGGIAPESDFVTTWYKTRIGDATTTGGVIVLAIKATGQVKA